VDYGCFVFDYGNTTNHKVVFEVYIMERKRYLELCQKYVIGCDVRVEYKGTEYHPYRYELGFDNNGKSIHTAILKDLKANSLLKCRLEDVKEC
jgi:hypothetical protein